MDTAKSFSTSFILEIQLLIVSICWDSDVDCLIHEPPHISFNHIFSSLLIISYTPFMLTSQINHITYAYKFCKSIIKALRHSRGWKLTVKVTHSSNLWSAYLSNEELSDVHNFIIHVIRQCTWTLLCIVNVCEENWHKNIFNTHSQYANCQKHSKSFYLLAIMQLFHQVIDDITKFKTPWIRMHDCFCNAYDAFSWITMWWLYRGTLYCNTYLENLYSRVCCNA